MEKLPRKLIVLMLSVVVGIAELVYAEDFSLSGHAKTQSSLLDSTDEIRSQSFDLRLNADTSNRYVGAESALQFASLGSWPLPSLATESGDLLPSDKTRLMRLTTALDDEGNAASGLRLDRLALRLESGPLFLKVGRQALSVGKGIVFQSLDVFNPFPPLAIDTEYKPGDDMVVASYDLPYEWRVQLFGVGRRSMVDEDLSGEDSSFVARGSGRVLGGDLEFIGAQHYGEPLWGLGGAFDFLDAVVRAEVATKRVTSDSKPSLLVNMDRGTEVGGKDVYFFAEYFYSGFGSNDSESGSPPTDVAILVQRGELFTQEHHYGAFGFRVEITPLTTVLLSSIVNVEDFSSLVQPICKTSLSDSVSAQIGASVPTGGLDEFGAGNSTEGYFKENLYFARLEYHF